MLKSDTQRIKANITTYSGPCFIGGNRGVVMQQNIARRNLLPARYHVGDYAVPVPIVCAGLRHPPTLKENTRIIGRFPANIRFQSFLMDNQITPYRRLTETAKFYRRSQELVFRRGNPIELNNFPTATGG